MNKIKPVVPNIFLCIGLDLAGMATYLIPALGEELTWYGPPFLQ